MRPAPLALWVALAPAVALAQFTFVGPDHVVWACACGGQTQTCAAAPDCGLNNGALVSPTGVSGDFQCCPSCLHDNVTAVGTLLSWGCAEPMPSDCQKPPGGGTSGSPCHSPGDVCSQGNCVQDSPMSPDPGGGPPASMGSSSCHLSSTESACSPAPRQPKGNLCKGPGGGALGGTSHKGDPISVFQRHTHHRVSDFSLPTTLGSFDFSHSYVGSHYDWAFSQALGKQGGAFLPKPFGAAEGYQASLRWSHSLYSLVAATGAGLDGGGSWVVRLGTGEAFEYTPCPGPSCFATPAPRNGEVGARLYKSTLADGGVEFKVFDERLGRLTFGAVWLAPDGGEAKYFLTRMEDSQYPQSGGSARVLASLSYAIPDAGACPGLSAGGSPGAPYLDAVTLTEGQKLTFKYARLPSIAGVLGGAECVLSQVRLMDEPHGGSTASSPLVSFGYAAPLDGGSTASAGRLASTVWGNGTRSQRYEYTRATTSGTWKLWEHPDAGGGTELLEHAFTLDSHRDEVVAAEHLFEPTSRPQNVYALTSYYTGCDAGAPYASSPYCTAAAAYGFRQDSVSIGDTYGVASSSRTVYLNLEQSSVSRGRRTPSEWEGACAGLACASFSAPGSEHFEYARLPEGRTVNRGYQDKRASWLTSDVTVPDAGFGGGVGVVPPEFRALYRGASTVSGAGALETVQQSYQYGGAGQTPRAFEQSVATQARASVLQPGQNAVTSYVREPATNRLKAVIRGGYTQTWSAGTSSWDVGQKFVGTFYFTRRVCSGEAADDALGRVVEVHGPCFADSASADDCSAGTLQPVTQYFYYASSTGNNNAGRLQKVARYASHGGLTSCTGYSTLDTTYAGYDAAGNPGSVTDENGVTTTFTYDSEGRVKSKSLTVSGQANTTSYLYDGSKLTAVQFPEGNWEVYCYRRVANAVSCAVSGAGAGAWTPYLRWKGKAAAFSQSGNMTVSESITYQYSPDTTVKRMVFGGSSGTRREVRLAADGNLRPTLENYGSTPTGTSGSFATRRLFDGADNLVGVGLPFNNAPGLCGGISSGQPVSALCAALSYDAANRLEAFTVSGRRDPRESGRDGVVSIDVSMNKSQPSPEVARRWDEHGARA